MAVKKNYIKVVAKNGMVHIIPDSKENRAFQTRYHRHADAKDRPKKVAIVEGSYTRDNETNELQFDETGELEVIFQDISPEDSKLAAANQHNSALQAQVEFLQQQLAEKNKQLTGAAKNGTPGHVAAPLAVENGLVDPTAQGDAAPKKRGTKPKENAGKGGGEDGDKGDA
jgi:hypothetical protein